MTACFGTFPHTTAHDPYQGFRDFLSSPCEVEPHLFVDTWTDTTPPGGLPEPTPEQMWAADPEAFVPETASMIKPATPGGMDVATTIQEIALRQGVSVTEVQPEQEYEREIDYPVGIHSSGLNYLDMALEMLGEPGAEPVKGRPLTKILLPGLDPASPMAQEESPEEVEECNEMGVPQPDGRPILPPDTQEQLEAMDQPAPWTPLTPEQEELIRVAGIEVEEETEDLLETLEEEIEGAHENDLDYFPDTVIMIEEIMEKVSPEVAEEPAECAPEAEAVPDTNFMGFTPGGEAIFSNHVLTSSFAPAMDNPVSLEVKGSATFYGDVTIKGNLNLEVKEPEKTVDSVYGLPIVNGEPAPWAQDLWVADYVLRGKPMQVQTHEDLGKIRSFIETAKYALMV